MIAALLALTLVQDDLGRKIDEAVQRSTSGGFWGAILVAKGGKPILAKGYGFADYATTPNSPTTLFEIASTSKQFTAAAILKLEMEGKLKTDDTLPKFFKDVPDDKKEITLHQLLTHTSGLSPGVGLPYVSTATRDELAAEVLKAPLDSEPGSTFAYCNFAYALLAAVVEVASGRSFEDYSKEELFKPAGMKDTGFIKDKALDPKRAAARLAEGGDADWTAVNWFWGWGYRGMGGVVSTADDLLAWDRALRGDAVLDKAAKEKLYAPEKDNYACGWMMETTARGTRKAHHGGGVSGFHTFLSRFLEDDATIIVLTNEQGDFYAIESAVSDLLFPAPKIDVKLSWGKRELTKYQALELKKAAWGARREGDGVTLALTEGDDEVATIAMPAGVAKKVAADLEAALKGRKPDGDPAIEAGLYLVTYELDGDTLRLGDGLEVSVLPRYEGVDEEGREIIDDRPTFILVDRKKGQWPVMAKMNAAAAQKLLDGVRQALK